MPSWSGDQEQEPRGPWTTLGMSRSEWIEADRLAEQLERQTDAATWSSEADLSQIECGYMLADYEPTPPTLVERTYDRPDQVPDVPPPAPRRAAVLVACTRPGCSGTMPLDVPRGRGRPRLYCGSAECRAARRTAARAQYLELIGRVHELVHQEQDQ